MLLCDNTGNTDNTLRCVQKRHNADEDNVAHGGNRYATCLGTTMQTQHTFIAVRRQEASKFRGLRTSAIEELRCADRRDAVTS